MGDRVRKLWKTGRNLPNLLARDTTPPDNPACMAVGRYGLAIQGW